LGPERACHRRPKGEGLAGPVHIEDRGGGISGNKWSESGGREPDRRMGARGGEGRPDVREEPTR
jgi:hypothetical protein